RITMAEFGTGGPTPATAAQTYPRRSWKAPGAEQGPYAIALDQGARLHLNTGRAGGDPIILVLTEAAPHDHFAELRRDGISYILAGRDEIDLARALEILADEFGIRRLLLEGGGINGSFLAAGLIDEISLLLLPVADGCAGLPTTFDRPPGAARPLRLQSVDRLEGDLLHLRYEAIGQECPLEGCRFRAPAQPPSPRPSPPLGGGEGGEQQTSSAGGGGGGGAAPGRAGGGGGGGAGAAARPLRKRV